MAIEEDEPIGIPEWVVTFGDMMSLLLTFFIMLVSFSEIKEEEKYQAMVESVRRRFGYEQSVSSPMPGDIEPRNSNHDSMQAAGRADLAGLENGGDKVQAPTGDYPHVRIIRQGGRTAVGSVFVFNEEQVDLNDEQRHEIDQLIPQLAGKPQKVEIRGHTSLRPLSEGGHYDENWNLAYQRALRIKDYLMSQGIEEHRMRVSAAGPWEPMIAEADPDQLWLNPRVEVFLLDEYPTNPQSIEEAPTRRRGVTPPAASGEATHSSPENETSDPPAAASEPAAAADDSN